MRVYKEGTKFKTPHSSGRMFVPLDSDNMFPGKSRLDEKPDDVSRKARAGRVLVMRQLVDLGLPLFEGDD